MNKPLRVLIVEDFENDAELLLSALRRGGYEPKFERVETAEAMVAALKKQTWDVVIADYVMPQLSGLQALKILQATGLDLPFIVVSGNIGEETAVTVMKAGAHDYLLKDRLARLCPAIAKEMADAQTRREQRQAETALRESEDRYRRLVDSFPEAMHVQSQEKFVYVNPAQMKLLGAAAPGDLIGKPVLDFVHPKSQKNARERMSQRRKEARRATLSEEIWIHFDGYPIIVEAVQTAIAYHGEAAAQVVLRDITVRKQLEEQLRQSQKMEAIGRLAGGVAHDFNNIMAVILGYSSFLRAAFKPGDPLHDDTEQICKHAERAVAITRQLLAFGRKQVMTPVPLDLNGLVLNAHNLLGRLIGEDIELQVITSPDPCIVKADSSQMEQVILNLAVNAGDAMPTGGKLVIETANVTLGADFARNHTDLEPGEYAMLAVTDTGAGMSESVKAHVFEPFFTTKEGGKGGGLGLATAYGIIKQHRGDISCYSEVGKGTSFKVYLPRLHEAVVLRPPTSAPVELREGEGAETVLFVEDEEALRELAQLMLGKKGYRVITAKNGEEALHICRDAKEPIDLLLTDVVMPKMNGPDLARHFTRWHPNACVLYISGYTENVILLHGIERSEINFLQKPFTSAMLAQKVREVLDRAKKEHLLAAK